MHTFLFQCVTNLCMTARMKKQWWASNKKNSLRLYNKIETVNLKTTTNISIELLRPNCAQKFSLQLPNTFIIKQKSLHSIPPSLLSTCPMKLYSNSTHLFYIIWVRRLIWIVTLWFCACLARCGNGWMKRISSATVAVKLQLTCNRNNRQEN